MNRLIWITILAGVFAFAVVTAPAFADTVVGSGSWQLFPTLAEDGNPYWDNRSFDGSKMNIGYLLSGTSSNPTLNSHSPNITPPWWGNGDGSADANFHFANDAPYLRATLHFEVASKAGINEFGWYDRLTGATNTLFAPADSPVVAVDFKPTAHYGFYLITDNATYYTESSKNTGSHAGQQHFSLFNGPGAYWIGAEDLPFAGGDRDYQDAVVQVQAVPEPSSLIVLGSSCMGAIGYVLRRRRANSA